MHRVAIFHDGGGRTVSGEIKKGIGSGATHHKHKRHGKKDGGKECIVNCVIRGEFLVSANTSPVCRLVTAEERDGVRW